MSDLDLRERRELCDLMLELGPAAPTLCGEWTTFDLAAHLVVRERNPLSAPGILFGGPFDRFTESLMDREQRRGFEAVVERVRTPPPGPLSIRAVGSAINFVEYLVHHEDVRRPNGLGPRTDRDDLQREAWGRLRHLAPAILLKSRISPVSLELVATGAVSDTRRVGRSDDHRVRVVGPPVELLLFLYGRQANAAVETEGPAADAEIARRAAFGI